MKYFYRGKFIEIEDQNFMKKELAFNSFKSERIATVLKMIDKEPKKILDVGCGIGILDKYLGERGHQITGIDILEDSIKIAQKYFSNKNVKYICGDVLEMKPLKDSFDLILFLETIEHVENPTAFLKRFRELLKPNGELIVSTPNSTGITNVLYNLKHSLDFVKKVEKESANTGTEADHINSFDKICLYRLLYRQGFKYIDHKITNKFNPMNYQAIIIKVKK